MAQGQPKEPMDASDMLAMAGLMMIVVLVLYFLFSDYIQFYANYIGSWMLFPFAYFSVFDSREHYLNMLDFRYSAGDALHYAQLYYLPIFVIPGLYLTWFLYKSDYLTRFLFTMNLKELIHYQADFFHQSKPASRAIKAGFLSHEPRTSGPWARQKTSKEYVENLGFNVNFTEEDTDEIRLLKQQLIKPLSHQLGGKFKGITKMKPHEYLLAAVFLSFINGNKDLNDDHKGSGVVGGEAMLDLINQHYLEPALNTKTQVKGKDNLPYYPLFLKDVMPVFRKNKKLIQQFARQHAYTSTMLLRMLYEARGFGMLPPSAFLWLKTADRPLWYALHQLGPFIQGEIIRTRCVCAEASGTHAHYKSEILAGYRLDQPFVYSAAEGITETVAKKIL